jgi:hypothetical protein
MRAKLDLISREAASGLSRESLLRDAITETLGKLSNLHEEEYIIGWWWSSNCFHLAHTVRAERIEAHTILHGYHVLL